MDNEIWVPVNNFNGLFDISNMGNVRSYRTIGRSINTSIVPSNISPCIDGRGYLNFTASNKPDNKIVLLIHRQVAMHFIANPNNYKIVRHLNDIKSDNRVCNLAWGTYRDNRADAIKNGKNITQKGKSAASRKLDEVIVNIIFNSDKNNCELGREYGVSEATISKIKLGRTWNRITGLPKIK